MYERTRCILNFWPLVASPIVIGGASDRTCRLVDIFNPACFDSSRKPTKGRHAITVRSFMRPSCSEFITLSIAANIHNNTSIISTLL
jgi:hypothetical protein